MFIWNNWFKFCIKYFLLICLFGISERLSCYPNECVSNIYNHNKFILDRAPDYFWNENKKIFSWKEGENFTLEKGGYETKGSAGIVPYAIYQNKVYVLVSRETWGKDKHTYCDLGGAVEAYFDSKSSVHVDTFLFTLLKEASEESGCLYSFTEDEILNQGYVISHIHLKDDFYKDYESIIVLFEVKDIYFTDQFIASSQVYARELENLHLCPWSFQEKDDFQWIELSSLCDFLKNSDNNVSIFKNLLNEDVEIKFRPHFIEVLRSKHALEVLLSIIKEHAFLSLVEEMSL